MGNNPRPNKYAATCYVCHKTVNAGAGHLERRSLSGNWLVKHAECLSVVGASGPVPTAEELQALIIKPKLFIFDHIKNQLSPAADNYKINKMKIHEERIIVDIEYNGESYNLSIPRTGNSAKMSDVKAQLVDAVGVPDHNGGRVRGMIMQIKATIADGEKIGGMFDE